MGRRGRIWLIAALLVILGGFFSIVGILTGRARSVTRIVMDRWAETLGTPDDVLARYPRQEINDRGVELVEAARKIGIDLAPHDESDPAWPDQTLPKRLKQFRGDSAGWLRTQLSRGDGFPDPAPAAVLEFLREFREPIGEIQDLLLAADAPAWSRDIARLWDSPLPNLRGHADLNKVLLAQCLWSLEATDPQAAERALEAAWRLGETLEDDPALIVQSTRQSMLRAQAATVRQLPWLDHWIPRLDGSRCRAALERGLLHEGWAWPQINFRPRPDQSIGNKIQAVVLGPYAELTAADTSERWRRKVVDLGEFETLCRPDLERLGVRLDLRFPWWNRYGEILAFDIDGTLGRLALTQLQLELSQKLLELERIRRDTGRWPDPGAGWLESEACRSDRWIYTTDGAKASLQLSREPNDPKDRQGPLAWSFELSERRFARNDR